MWLRHDEPGTRQTAELASERIASLVRVRKAKKTAELRAQKKSDKKAQKEAADAESVKRNIRKLIEHGQRPATGQHQCLTT